MNLATFFATIKLYRKTFGAACAAVVIAGLSWVLLNPTPSVSTTQLMVSIEGTTTATAYENDEVVAGRVNSYVALLTSDVVSQRVVDELDLPETPQELAEQVSATIVPPRTAIIDVAVTDESSARAQLLADTFAREFIEYADALETPTGADGQKVHTTVVTAATEPHEQRVERIGLIVIIVLAGIVLAAIAVWVRAQTDPVVRTASRAAQLSGLPVIGSVPEVRNADGPDFESYRRLRTHLGSAGDRLYGSHRSGMVWVITSVAGEADSSVLAANLGRALELRDGRVTVIDAAEDPVADLGAGDSRGPDSVGPAPLRKSDDRPAPTTPTKWGTDTGDLPTAFGELTNRVRKDYAHVVVAAPPVLASCTASVMSDFADGVLLAISFHVTLRRDLVEAAERLRDTGAPLLGTVHVDVDTTTTVRRPDKSVDTPVL
ncbi:hypothetical protein [Rhodococcus phenolicus]|uniref:hypothetical protein n=1 Tax=Rhodococcus phenolicus TaxID=263849 RepID=UPI00082AA920|nr:hypothetical protein [Rhodococcus phenolicus]